MYQQTNSLLCFLLKYIRHILHLAVVGKLDSQQTKKEDG